MWKINKETVLKDSVPRLFLNGTGKEREFVLTKYELPDKVFRQIVKSLRYIYFILTEREVCATEISDHCFEVENYGSKNSL